MLRIAIFAYLVSTNAVAADAVIARADKYGNSTGQGGYVVEGNRVVPIDAYGNKTGGDGYKVEKDGTWKPVNVYGNPIPGKDNLKVEKKP